MTIYSTFSPELLQFQCSFTLVLLHFYISLVRVRSQFQMSFSPVPVQVQYSSRPSSNADLVHFQSSSICRFRAHLVQRLILAQIYIGFCPFLVHIRSGISSLSIQVKSSPRPDLVQFKLRCGSDFSPVPVQLLPMLRPVFSFVISGLQFQPTFSPDLLQIQSYSNPGSVQF